ncbi:hypothetical protein ACGF12_32290 [Kitasatospora sp. NPDC048296]|uniref:hypothetical protein n=1 Tax=Kitasatospora sp. NPDC048296 TaxID=3364048 RepID=UPI00370FC9B0
MGSRMVGRAGGVLVGGLTALLAGCSGHHAPPRPPAPTQPFVAFNACLVTGPSGLDAAGPGSEAWAGTQAATGSLHARASYVTAAPTALPDVLGALLLRHCTVVVAAGDTSAGGQFTAAVAEFGRAHPEQRVLLVEAPADVAGNVRPIAGGDGLADRVRQAVTAAAGGN